MLLKLFKFEAITELTYLDLLEGFFNIPIVTAAIISSHM